MIQSRLLLSILMISVMVLLFCFAKINGGFISWFLFYFFLVVVLYEFATSWFALRRVQLKRQVSTHHLSASQALDIKFSFIQHSVWPLFYATIYDELPERLSLRAHSPVQTIMPLWKKQVDCGYRIEKLQRGIYHLMDVRIESGDLFGIQRLSKTFHCPDVIVVYPHIVPIRGWNSIYVEKTDQRQPFLRRHEESTNVIGVRGYVPGDRLSRIHWPASARTGVLQAKEFEQHVSNEWLFIPDMSRHSFVRHDHGRLFDLEMTITASLMKYAYDTRKKFSAGMYTNRLLHFSAVRNQGPFLQCMEALAELEPISQVPFSDSLQRLTTEFQAGHTFVIISPYFTKEMASVFANVRRHNPVEWFVPMAKTALSTEELHLVHSLQAQHIRVQLISSPEQLAMLEQGGIKNGKMV